MPNLGPVRARLNISGSAALAVSWTLADLTDVFAANEVVPGFVEVEVAVPRRLYYRWP